MRTLPVAPTQLAPLERSNRDGIGRLARRTQRGQGRRRLLVSALIALSVLLGVGSAVFAATMIHSDQTVGMADRFGDAVAMVAAAEPGGFHGLSRLSLGDLTPAQRAWLDDHGGEATPVDESPDLPLPVLQALGLEPVVVPPSDVLAELDVAADEVLAFRTSGMYSFFFGGDETLITDLDVTHPLAGTTFDAGGRTAPLTGDEALLSPSLLAQLGVEVGETTALPGVGHIEVVGTATRAYMRPQQVAIVAPHRDFDGLDGAERVVRFADTAPAERYGQVAQQLLRERYASLPEPTAEQRAQLGMAEGDMQRPQPYGMGDNVQLRSDHEQGFATERSMASIVGGTVTALATVIAAIVGACAFAVGMRRRIRQIGMLGAVGASPKQLGRLLRREGLVIGVGGALIGGAIGLLLAAPIVTVAERVVGRDLQVVIPTVGVLLPILVGALGAYLAAASPARTAARVPVVTALAGRVPLGTVPAWVPVVGAAAAVTGVLLLTDLMTGAPNNGGLAAVQLLGAVLLATLGTAALGIPAIALGGRIADRLPLLGRLALRDAARQRTRSAAAVAALVPVMALPVAAGTTLMNEMAFSTSTVNGVEVQPPRYVERGASSLVIVTGPYFQDRQVPPSEASIEEIAAALPPTTDRADLVWLGDPDLSPQPATVVLPWDAEGRISSDPVSDVGAQPGAGHAWGQRLALATPEVLTALGLPADAVPADGGLLLAGTEWIELPSGIDELPVVQWDPDGEAAPDGGAGDQRESSMPGADRLLGALPLTVDTTVTGGVHPGVLVDPAAADRLGLAETSRGVLVRLERTPTQAEAFEAMTRRNASPDAGGGVAVSGEQPFWTTPRGIAVLVALAIVAVTLGVAAVAGMTTALAATESDADVRKAVALGAPPSLRRRLHGLQAWWHVTLAAVLGSALGLAVAGTFVRTGSLGTGRPAFEVPWLALAGWVVVVPLLVGLIIAAVMRSAPVGAPQRRTA